MTQIEIIIAIGVAWALISTTYIGILSDLIYEKACLIDPSLKEKIKNKHIIFLYDKKFDTFQRMILSGEIDSLDEKIATMARSIRTTLNMHIPVILLLLIFWLMAQD